MINETQLELLILAKQKNFKKIHYLSQSLKVKKITQNQYNIMKKYKNKKIMYKT